MAEDARFEDGAPTNTPGDSPVALKAMEAADVPVLSALIQDAVFPITEMRFDRKRRRLALLLNRFRWEDHGTRGPERVQSVLTVEDAQAVRSQGINRGDTDTILSLLALSWHPGEDGTGTVELVLAGDGVIEVSVEVLDLTLRDVTRPYHAPSGKAPDHGA